MTDRTDHRAAAERMLADADEWAAQAEEPTPEAGELSCLAWAAVHALLAIHEALTDLKPEPVTYAALAAERGTLATSVERVRALAVEYEEQALREGYGGELWSTTAAAIRRALNAATDTGAAADRYAANEAKQREAGDADGAPSVTASVADDPGDDAVDGEEGERRNLNAQTGHERARMTAQLRQVISSVQDSGDLAELDALADAWEAR